jgi:hypothetical protein
MYKMMFSLQNTNNGALSGDKAMPQKDITSDNASSFQMGRKMYIDTLPEPIEPTKKWMPAVRDASDIARRRRIAAVGKGSINVSPNVLSFTTYKDVNTTNDALRRARAGGAVAPPKKNAQTFNPITPRYAPAVPTTTIVPNKYPTLFH